MIMEITEITVSASIRVNARRVDASQVDEGLMGLSKLSRSLFFNDGKLSWRHLYSNSLR
jgi:hypothetical protein